jgi:S1-C subfamily serine protease
VISKDGWIVTNYHVAFDSETGRPHSDLAIGFTRNPRDKPELTCLASPESGAYDAALDIAIIKCDRDLSGNPLSEKLSYSPVPIGDSESVDIGDELHIIGYPGVGGETINFTSGKVSGFIGEDGNRAGDRWFKTEAALAPGNSGGAAVNSKGEMIGVPTRILSDSRGTGLVSRVNLVRPMKYVTTFLESPAKKSRAVAEKTKPAPAASGVSVAGFMVSAATGDPIPGALVLFLQPGVRTNEVTGENWSSKVFTKSFSARDGSFHTESPLLRGKSYGVMILAEGYQPILVDEGVSISNKGAPEFDLGAIEMMPE